jgi:hypothetical protein
MPSRRKKGKAVPFNAADVATIAKANPYIHRLIEDASLRENVAKAIESTRSAYDRITNGKAPAKALIDDKKLQNDLRNAVEAVRDAATALTESPRKQARKRARKGMRLGRKVMILGLGGALALAGSEKLRSKVLDTLFGAEEEFEYTPPATTAPSSPATPVSAA